MNINTLQQICDQANQLFQQQKYTEAIQLYSSVIEQSSTISTSSLQQEIKLLQIKAYNNKSQCFLNQNNFVEAKLAAQTVLQLDPSNSKAWFRTYKSQLSLHQYWSALLSLSQMERICQTKMISEKLALCNMLRCFDLYTCFEMIFQYISSPYFGQHFSKQCIAIQEKPYHVTWQIQEISNAVAVPQFSNSNQILEQFHQFFTSQLQLSTDLIANEFLDFQQSVWNPQHFQELDRIMYHIFAQGMKRSKGFVTLLLMRLVIKFMFGGNSKISTLSSPSVEDNDTKYETEMNHSVQQIRLQFPHYKRIALLLHSSSQKWDIIKEFNLLHVLNRVAKDVTWFGIGKGGALIRDMDENFLLEFTTLKQSNESFIVDLFPTSSGFATHVKQVPFLVCKVMHREIDDYLYQGKQYKLKKEWKSNTAQALDQMLEYIHKHFLRETYLSAEVKQEFMQCCSQFDTMVAPLIQ